MRALDNYITEVEYTRTQPDGYNCPWAAAGNWLTEWEEWVDHKVEIHQKKPVDGIYGGCCADRIDQQAIN